MTLILKLDTDAVKMYLHAEINFLVLVVQKLPHELTNRWMERQTDLTEIITYMNMQMVNIMKY